MTQDIVGFRRCARQYGEFHVHKYAPAYQTHRYFGTVLHQVLDRCHSHFKGIPNLATAGTLPQGGVVLPTATIDAYLTIADASIRVGSAVPPSPGDIVDFFLDVEAGLKSRGIRAVQKSQRLQAIRILQYFNAVEGPTLFPLVQDSEFRLQGDQGSYTLHGVVDLLLGNGSGAAGGEIWDYKGTRFQGMTPASRATYTLQMQVYAKLYEMKTGVLPSRVVIYLLNELDGPTAPTTRPVNAVFQIDATNGLSAAAVNASVAAFGLTVNAIESARAVDRWPPATLGTIDPQDCAICDLRWDCATPAAGGSPPTRYP